MSRQLSVLLSSLRITGMILLDRQVFAQHPKEITNSIGMKLVLIPKGTFQMTEAPSLEKLQSYLDNRYIKTDGDKEIFQDTKVQVTISKDCDVSVTMAHS